MVARFTRPLTPLRLDPLRLDPSDPLHTASHATLLAPTESGSAERSSVEANSPGVTVPSVTSARRSGLMMGAAACALLSTNACSAIPHLRSASSTPARSASASPLAPTDASAAATVAHSTTSIGSAETATPPFSGSEPLFSRSSDHERFSESGTFIMSLRAPDRQLSSSNGVVSGAPAPLAAPEVPPAAALDRDGVPQRLAPLIGYFPPAISYMPAENETWLELSRQQSTLTLYKGNSVVKEMKVEGSVALEPGDYFLQHKQKDPLWYAPNEYFAKRQLTVPPENDRRRYRKGALGKFALFPTTTFPIHCAPVWTNDVGGVRVSEEDLHSIFVMIPVGAPVVIK